MKQLFVELSVYEIVVLSVFALAFLIQLFYYLLIYLRVALVRQQKILNREADLPAVSVVICARDEELNLKSFLPSVLQQDYPNYEVVVVDDCSTDDTDMLLDLFSRKYNHLRYTRIKQDEKFTHGKKLALTVGIKAAKHEWLLLTDADCKPVSSNWITAMATNFKAETQVVLGYGGFFQQNGFLNKFIRFDAFFIALQYLGFALAGMPYMGVGRNLAYRKDLFFSNRGFASHNHILSGDDDLFVHEVANKKNTKIEIQHDSHTISNPKETFSAWVRQKKRHTSTGYLYKKHIKFALILEPFSRMVFWILGFSLMFSLNLIWIAAGTILFRLLLNGIIIKIVSIRLNEKKLFIPSLVYDLLSPIFYFAVHIANRLTPRISKWN